MKKPSLSRVTSVLSYVNAEWYRYWAKSIGLTECDRISKESAAFGTAVHKLVEAYVLAPDEPLIASIEEYTERQIECAKHIVNWLIEVKAKPRYVEQELVDKKLGLIGHCDLLAEINGCIYIIDFKTSKEVKRGMPLQLAAYAHMAEKQLKISVDNGIILRVPSDPAADCQFEVKEFHELRKVYLPVFKQCLAVYQYFEKKGIWKGN